MGTRKNLLSPVHPDYRGWLEVMKIDSQIIYHTTSLQSYPMFIEEFKLSFRSGESKQAKLRPGLVLDPRVNYPLYRNFRFRVDYQEDGTAILHRTDDEMGRLDSFSMRVYDPTTENVPDFDSTFYTYKGQKGERAPKDTTHAKIDDLVEIIRENAFANCEGLECCEIHDGVKIIEKMAFRNCKSLEALFLPSGLEEIQELAFSKCSKIRILSLPLDISIEQFGAGIIDGCHSFFETPYGYFPPCRQYRDQVRRVHRAILDLYRNQPNLHKICLRTNVSAQAIIECTQKYGSAIASVTDHNGMTPLHILAINPHGNFAQIMFKVDFDALLVVKDNLKNTPLDYLRVYQMEIHTSFVTALCLHRNAQMNCTVVPTQQPARSLKRKRENHEKKNAGIIL